MKKSVKIAAVVLGIIAVAVFAVYAGSVVGDFLATIALLLLGALVAISLTLTVEEILYKGWKYTFMTMMPYLAIAALVAGIGLYGSALVQILEVKGTTADVCAYLFFSGLGLLVLVVVIAWVIGIIKKIVKKLKK